MAVLRDSITPDNTVNYIATLAFFCGISCVTLMLKFGGFKASLNFYNGKKKNKELNNSGPEISMNGAYRTNRDEFFGYSHNPEPQRKLTPSVRPTPLPDPVERPLRAVKSTSDLTKNKNLPPNLRQSNTSISNDPRGVELENRNDRHQEPVKLDAEKRLEKQRLEEQKKLEKQRVEEQKKLEKQRVEEQKKVEKQRVEEQKKKLQEQARQEKLRKEQEKRNKKKKAPAKPIANPLAQGRQQPQYSTNTLESSISRTSGPPPYSDVPKPDLVKNEADSSGNVSFSKPIDTGSWDLISQHRQQINRPVNTTPDRKQMVMDLKYNMDDINESETKENSEA